MAFCKIRYTFALFLFLLCKAGALAGLCFRLNGMGKSNFLVRYWNNFYFRHVLLAVLTLIILIFGSLLILNIITRHGQTYIVPDLTNMRPADALEIARQSSVTLVVDDSIYTARKPRGIILEQTPRPNTRVKKWRKIFVRINAQSVQMTSAPNVVEASLRQARAMIESRGLEVGRLSFSPDWAHGIVLSQTYRGRPLAPNAKLPVESRIDLEIGQGGIYETRTPPLAGMTLNAAKTAITDAMLNVGRVMYDHTAQNITDSLNAVVYAQFPPADDPVSLGSAVDIMLSVRPPEYQGEE